MPFTYAVTLAWDDLKKPIEPRSVRVEYLCEPETALDHASVWSVRAPGYQDLVCDYWTQMSSAHPTSMCFENGYYSDRLARTIEFIMSNQGQFTRPADAGRHGLVQIHPPHADDRTEAAAWIKRAQPLGFEASPEETHLHQCNATVSDEPVEAPKKTSAENYFELRYAWPE